MKIKKNLILLFNFFIHLLTDNSFATYRLCDFWYSAQKKNQKIYEKKELLGWKEIGLEGF
jgi:hypothetical protein